MAPSPDLSLALARTSRVDRREFLLGATALAMAPRLRRASALRPAALVTADLESRLVVVDLPGGHVREHLATLPFPRSIERAGRTVVVAHSEIGAVTLVDSPSLAIRSVFHDFSEPRYTAAHPDGRHAYVTDARRGEVVAIDVHAARVLGRAHVGPRARHVSVDPAGRTLWIALGTKAEEIAVVDVTERARPRLVRRFRPPFLAHDVGFAPDGRRAWVSSGDRNRLAVYDTRTGRLLARPYGDAPPQHVTFSGGRVYVTSGWSGTLRVHRTDGRSLARTVVPVGSYNVQDALGWVVTPALGRGYLTVCDERARIRRSERIARSSHDACIVAA
jgi:DNA-binding beta-propeller fold protein YncE